MTDGQIGQDLERSVVSELVMSLHRKVDVLTETTGEVKNNVAELDRKVGIQNGRVGKSEVKIERIEERLNDRDEMDIRKAERKAGARAERDRVWRLASFVWRLGTRKELVTWLLLAAGGVGIWMKG